MVSVFPPERPGHNSLPTFNRELVAFLFLCLVEYFLCKVQTVGCDEVQSDVQVHCSFFLDSGHVTSVYLNRLTNGFWFCEPKGAIYKGI